MVEKLITDFEGEYTSISGKKGKNGLSPRGGAALEIVATGTNILLQNGARVYATIRNSTDGPNQVPTGMWLCLDGATGLDNDQKLLLMPGDVFRVDRDHPWSGPVTGFTEVGVTSGVDWLEVSLT